MSWCKLSFRNKRIIILSCLSFGIFLYMLPRDNDSLMMLVKCFSLDN